MTENLAYREQPREELIGGKVVMMAPRPAWNHLAVSGSIYNIFSDYLRGKTCTPIQDGFDLFLTDEDHFVPDFMIVCNPEKIKWNGVYGAPDLVAEVLSPSTAKNDKKHKKAVYAQCGVREYWIVNPVDKSVEQYFLEDGQFVLHEVYTLYPDYALEAMTQEERAAVITHFKCSLFDDLDISLEDVFYRTF